MIAPTPAPPPRPPARPTSGLGLARNVAWLIGILLALGGMVAAATGGIGIAVGLALAAAICAASALLLGFAQTQNANLTATQDALASALHEARRSAAAGSATTEARVAYLDSLGTQLQGTIRSVTGLADTLLSTELDPVQKQAATTLKDGCRNMATLVDDMVELGRLGRGSMSFSPGAVDLGRLVEDLVGTLAPGASSHGVELLAHVGAEVPGRVDSDPKRVRQLLLHLVHQVLPWTPGGHVIVRVDVAGPCVRVVVRGQGLTIPAEARSALEGSADSRLPQVVLVRRLVEVLRGKLSVGDDGLTVLLPCRLDEPAVTAEPLGTARVLVVGADDALVHILLDYARRWSVHVEAIATVDELGTRVAGGGVAAVMVSDVGSDLDLAAQAIGVDGPPVISLVPAGESIDPARHGRLSVACPPRRDSLHTVLADALPVSEGPVAAAPLRVLLVDDNRVNRLVARRFLERLGYDIDEAEDGAQAVEMARPGRYAAILMDLQMPVMNGFDATREIRRQLARSAPPIIAVTANVQATDRQRALDTGMVEHLGKPLDPNRLQAALDRWIPEVLRRPT